jgi:nucleoside-diphosphate-sugar epimerase
VERILVIGGTGATGAPLVNRLLAAGHELVILHGGQHEREFDAEVRHIHCDPHFSESLADGLAGEPAFDATVVMYGRLEQAIRVLANRTSRLVAVGGIMGANALHDDPAWGDLGMPMLVSEATERLLAHDAPEWPFGAKMARAQSALFAAHTAGAFQACYIGYPLLYGPAAPGPQDWCIVRRILDGRRQIVVQDGGLRYEMRGYIDNMAYATYLATVKPELASGRNYFVADTDQFTARQRIEFIARHMNANLEIIDVPYDQARPSHPFARFRRDHRIRDTRLSREVLGYRDVVAPPEAVARTVDWLVNNRPELGGIDEHKIGDPFDYTREDMLINAAVRFARAAAQISYELPEPVHQYRHPQRPGEEWTPPAGSWREKTG